MSCISFRVLKPHSNLTSLHLYISMFRIALHLYISMFRISNTPQSLKLSLVAHSIFFV
ncbi:hypothetical protein Hanom_Chr02g00134161 [Helianthus anomalus]